MRRLICHRANSNAYGARDPDARTDSNAKTHTNPDARTDTATYPGTGTSVSGCTSSGRAR
jgi:hypothetical protein